MALNLSKRMDLAEQRLTTLERLPERMTALESQILQLRTEMRAEFSAVCSELRAEIQAGDDRVTRTLREEIRSGDEETRRVLREEIRAGDEETRRVLREEIAALGTHMRVLHEEVISRISTIQEGRPGKPGWRRGARHPSAARSSSRPSPLLRVSWQSRFTGTASTPRPPFRFSPASITRRCSTAASRRTRPYI